MKKSNPLVDALRAKTKAPNTPIELPPLRTIEVSVGELPQGIQQGAPVELEVKARVQSISKDKATLEIFTVTPDVEEDDEESPIVTTQDSVSPGAA